jgi:NADH:ubiquinone oxidoreductase subunit 4 (subunit M)
MIGVFISLDLFLFYCFWELLLIPMYFLIGPGGAATGCTPRPSSWCTPSPAPS